MPYYHKLGEMPRKHHIWFHRNGAAPTYKNEGIAYEHVITTEGFNEAYSIMYHLRPPTLRYGATSNPLPLKGRGGMHPPTIYVRDHDLLRLSSLKRGEGWVRSLL